LGSLDREGQSGDGAELQLRSGQGLFIE